MSDTHPAPARPDEDELLSVPGRRPEVEVADPDEDHGLEINRRSLLGLGAFLALSIAGLYFLLPQLAGLEDTWRRIEYGSPYWMFVALLFGAGMFGS